MTKPTISTEELVDRLALLSLGKDLDEAEAWFDLALKAEANGHPLVAEEFFNTALSMEAAA